MAQNDLDALRQLGLSDVGARVYLTLLRKGPTSAGKISSESGVHRRNTYDALEQLVKKGVASFHEQDGVKIFSPGSPSALDALVEEKRFLLADLKASLTKQYCAKQEDPIVQVYRGADGLKAVLSDIMKRADEICYYNAGMQATRIHLKNYFPKWDKQRAEKGIKARMLYVNKPDVAKAARAVPLCQARPLPENYHADVVWWLYANRIVLTFWTEQPTIVVLESDELARSFKNMFEAMWRIASNGAKTARARKPCS